MTRLPLLLIALMLVACGNTAHRAETSPKRVSGVPSSLPPGGVKVDGMLLTPWASVPTGAMTRVQGIAAARKEVDPHPFPAAALAAELTDPGSLPHIDHVPVWLVTFTSPKPIDVNQGPPGSPPIYVTHYSVAINAVTGTFVRGFFEP